MLISLSPTKMYSIREFQISTNKDAFSMRNTICLENGSGKNSMIKKSDHSIASCSPSIQTITLEMVMMMLTLVLSKKSRTLWKSIRVKSERPSIWMVFKWIVSKIKWSSIENWWQTTKSKWVTLETTSLQIATASSFRTTRSSQVFLQVI